MKINESYLSVKQSTIYCKQLNVHHDITKPVILFLHEGLGCVDMWKDFPQKLCEKTRLNGLLYDRTGYGKSSPRQERIHIDFLKEEANLISEVLQKAGIQSPVILFGHSDGGSIALYAASDPELDIIACIVEAPHVMIEDITREGLLQTRSLWESGILLRKLKKYHGSKAEILFHEWIKLWLSEEGLRWNMLEALNDIYCRVFFVQGERDYFGSMQQWEEIEKRVKNETKKLEIPKCGHIPHLEAEDVVLQNVSEFIRVICHSKR